MKVSPKHDAKGTNFKIVLGIIFCGFMTTKLMGPLSAVSVQ